MATIILDKDALFKEAGLTRESAKFDFALRGTDGAGPDGAVFWGNPIMFETGSVRLDVSLPNGSWQLAAQPRNGRGTPGSPWLVEGGILLALLAGTLAWFLARNPAALRLRVLQATRDLKESEAHFRSLLENTSDFVMFRLVVQPGTPVGAEVLLISPSVHDIMGLPNPYSLASWFDCFDPDDIGWITARKDWSLAHGENFSAQLRWFHPQRQAWVWLSMLVTPATDAEGSTTHFNGIILDITTQKQAEYLLQRAYDALETQVGERTAELRKTNEQLKTEISEREYAEKTLRAQHDLYYALIKAQSDIGESVVIIENRRLVFANDASCRQFGYTLEELKALPSFIHLVHPDDRERILENHRRRLAGEPSESRHEIGIITRDGQRREAEIAVATIHKDNIPRIVVVVQDITERKRMGDALHSQLLFTQVLIEAIPSPLFFKDSRGAYLGCNKTFESALGVSRQKIIGKTVYDLAPRELADEYHEMDASLFKAPGHQIYESKVKFADGSVRDIMFNKATFADAGGNLGGLVGVMLDITERKQMEEALRRAHDELEARVQERTRELARINDELNTEIVSRKQAEKELRKSQASLLKAQRIAHLGNWDWDIVGGSLHWSDEIYRIFGVTPQQFDATYEAFLKSTHPNDRSGIVQSVDATLRTGEPYSIDHRIVLPDGSIRHVHEQAEVELDDAGQPVRMQGTVQDITERKRLEQQIIEVSEDEQKRIGQELHDGLGQHLTGIAFLSKALEQKLAAQSLPEAMDAGEIVKFVNQGISQTRALARNLFPVELEDNGLMSALEQLASNINKLFGISCTFTCDNPVLVHDRIAAINLYRIAREAANNAAKHSKADHIRIALAAADGKIHLSVTDDGIGFDPTRRANHEGMGCHIMRYRANMLGASLLIQKATGSGTEVRITMDFGNPPK